MLRKLWCAAALAAAVLPARAQESDAAKLREELQQLKQQLQKMERRLQETEAKSGKAEESAARAETTVTQAAAQASSRPQTESALNAGMASLINGVYSYLSSDPKSYHVNGRIRT